MEKHYFVIRANYWGAALTLNEALKNASVGIYSLFETCTDAVEYCDSAEELTRELKQIAKHPEDYEDEGETEFAVIITDSEKWKFTRACEFNGTPSYEWIGEGEKPEGLVPSTNINLTMNNKTGALSTREK